MSENTYILVIAAPDITDPVLDAIHKGPFTSIRESQEFAREWREAYGVPGHTNVVPTAEENEAWSNEGWVFGIFKLDTGITADPSEPGAPGNDDRRYDVLPEDGR